MNSLAFRLSLAESKQDQDQHYIKGNQVKFFPDEASKKNFTITLQ
jgi:hypothetical protein